MKDLKAQKLSAYLWMFPALSVQYLGEMDRTFMSGESVF
jgi:hypothetical protein